MMRQLVGKLRQRDMDNINSAIELRFKTPSMFKTPEALIIYEQRMMPEKVLRELCSAEYGSGVELKTPEPGYIAERMLRSFEGANCIPIRYDASENKVYLGVLPELETQDILFSYEVEKVYVPIYYYVKLYTKYYGEPDFLAEIPVLDKLNFIIEEATSIGASDITISTGSKSANVYFNVRKKKVRSNRILNKEDVESVIEILAGEAGATVTFDSNKPKFFSAPLNVNYRGRIVVNKTYRGHVVTIRVYSNYNFTTTLEDLNIGDKSIQFMRSVCMSPEKGLRLFIGETMSGKNTTILSLLSKYVEEDSYKIVSVEQPVEIIVDGIEQIQADTEDEFEENADSLLRQNPDVVYFTEITAKTAEAVLKQCNTAKAVFSTVHANSIADVISRLVDITGMSADRIILSMQSCVYQELVRDEDKDEIYPIDRCIYFSEELKSKLFGKPISQIRSILMEIENKWDLRQK